jgi:hypothetical protein
LHLLLTLLFVALQAATPASIRYLPVSSFPNLPKKIAAQLDARGCLIPQASGKTSNNVIRGSFAQKGQEDWAVLCSVNGESRVLLFWGGTGRCHSELDLSRDLDWLQDDKFSRRLTKTSPQHIRGYAKRYGSNLGMVVEHDGIDDGFQGKASVVLYCHQGTWKKLQGSD